MSNVAPVASKSPFNRRLACAAVAIALLPAAAMAQNRAGGRGAMAGLVRPAEMQKLLDDMDLSADAKTKVTDILDKAQSDMTDSMQGLRDATQEERQQKMQDMAKALTAAKTKVEAELTPAQKTEFAKKLAGLAFTRSEATVTAEKKAVDGLDDLEADKKKQADTLLDDTTKTLDGFKADADGVTDDAAGTTLAAKVQRTVQQANQQLTDILQTDQMQQVRRAGMQAALGGGGRAAGGAARRRRAASAPAN